MNTLLFCSIPTLAVHGTVSQSAISQGYSNSREVPEVVEQARIAISKYGFDAEIRVITFYNMQKYELEREFKRHGDLSHVLIASVRTPMCPYVEARR